MRKESYEVEHGNYSRLIFLSSWRGSSTFCEITRRRRELKFKTLLLVTIVMSRELASCIIFTVPGDWIAYRRPRFSSWSSDFGRSAQLIQFHSNEITFVLPVWLFMITGEKWNERQLCQNHAFTMIYQFGDEQRSASNLQHCGQFKSSCGTK